VIGIFPNVDIDKFAKTVINKISHPFVISVVAQKAHERCQIHIRIWFVVNSFKYFNPDKTIHVHIFDPTDSDIKDLESLPCNYSLEYTNQDTLNPNVFDGLQIKPKVREVLLKIANLIITDKGSKMKSCKLSVLLSGKVSILYNKIILLNYIANEIIVSINVLSSSDKE
jgi:hypothetical protein